MATAGAHTPPAARPTGRPTCGPTTMTILRDGVRSSSLENYSRNSRFTSDRNRQQHKWGSHRKENVETAMEFLPLEDDGDTSSHTKRRQSEGAGLPRPGSAGSVGRPGSGGGPGSRPGSSGSSRRAPPIQRSDSAGSGRRTPSTPTKQVTLQAVPRKQDRNEDSMEKMNWAEHRTHDELRLSSYRSEEDPLLSGMHNMSLASHPKPKETMTVQDLETSSSEEESSEDSSSEDQEGKAPSELLMEFITCLQEEDFENGKKLCQMILLYEPDHPEALKFHSLIDEKIDLEAELEEQSSDESDSEEEEESSEGETDEEEEGSESGEEESSSSESSSDEEDEEGDASSNIQAALEIPQIEQTP